MRRAVEPRYRTFWPRAAAGTVDAVLFLPVVLVSFLSYREGVPAWLRAAWYVAASLAYSAYVVVMHARYGQTLGKMAAGVRVLDVSGGRLSWRQALLREVVPIVLALVDIAFTVPAIEAGWNPARGEGPRPPGFVLGVQLAGVVGWFVAELVTMLANEKRRAIHDFIAGSVVARVREPAASGERAADASTGDSVRGAVGRSVRAHLGAGCLAVAGIAGLGTAVFIFPASVVAISGNGLRGALGLLKVPLASLAVALAIWLLLYLPLSVAAGWITKNRSTRVWLPAVLFMGGVGAAVLILTRHDHRYVLAKLTLLVLVFILGLGGGLYSWIQQWLVQREFRKRRVVARP